MIRNFLKGKEGDWINTIFAAVGFNFSKLLSERRYTTRSKICKRIWTLDLFI
ncbi:hypothetical protein LEP1GSC021_4965 [Leptospira noguchii str. 1993005606]|nr:hypothetical protein LEP1GSC021_4965 [Leptospira noguchii str. 1993005606]